MILEDEERMSKKGEVFVILGPNGAGKSTAVKLMTTLSRPNQGVVLDYR